MTAASHSVSIDGDISAACAFMEEIASFAEALDATRRMTFALAAISIDPRRYMGFETKAPVERKSAVTVNFCFALYCRDLGDAPVQIGFPDAHETLAKLLAMATERVGEAAPC